MVATCAALTLCIVGAVSIVALSIVLIDGLKAWIALAAAGLGGVWIFPLLGIADARPGERMILGGLFGIGLLALLTLGLGGLGLLSAPLLIVLLSMAGVAGLIRLLWDLRRPREPAARDGERTAADPFALLWLLAVPFFVLILLACTLPPGVLWVEEARGYDILEYHLGVPKIFHRQGAITFLPENVYSNFPLNYEMLALAMMTLEGDAVEASFMAKMVNTALAMLFVAASWLAGRIWSARAGIVAGVLAATTPWLTYLSGIAYVETGMLAMGMGSIACMLRASRKDGSPWQWTLLGGLLGGLACGFKYPALPMVVIPTAFLLLTIGRNARARFVCVVTFFVGVFITFAPWLIRNAVNTGNPVFPLATSVFGVSDEAWSADLAERWRAGHARPASAFEDEPTVARMLYGLQRVWFLTLGDFRIGYGLMVFALLGAGMHRDRLTLLLVAVLVLQFVVWLFFTHQYARFASVMMLPLVLMGARSLSRSIAPLATGAITVLLVFGAFGNLDQIRDQYVKEVKPFIDMDPGQEAPYGRTQVFLNGFEPTATLNGLGPQARILLVGEARIFYLLPEFDYAVVFNRHPLETILADRPGGDDPRQPLDEHEAAAVLRELRDRGFTHIFVHWNEVRRLRNSYGFPEAIHRGLFDRLETAGLKTYHAFYGEASQPWAVVYEVPGIPERATASRPVD